MKIERQSVMALSCLSEDSVLANFSQILNVPYGREGYDKEKTKAVIKSCISKGHFSVLEHANATLKCVTNIETYKDFTRHRHCAFTIESTSFVDYGNDMPLILSDKLQTDLPDVAHEAFIQAEYAYKRVQMKYGTKVARDLLPQSTMATMIMTTNFREWRWIIGLRGDPNDNPLTLQLRNGIWRCLHDLYPFFFPLAGSYYNNMSIYNNWGNKLALAVHEDMP